LVSSGSLRGRRGRRTTGGNREGREKGKLREYSAMAIGG